MAQVKPTYQGNDFKEWFKTHYGREYVNGEALSRPSSDAKGGMSDVDWDIGQSLLKYYKADQQSAGEYEASKKTLADAYDNRKSELERHYGAAANNLAKERSAATAKQDRTYELMKKYLPEQLKENGLAGSGFSESTMLGAYSTHANALGQIESDYQANKTSLENSRASELADYATEEVTKLSELERAYLGQKSDRDLAAGDAVEGVVDKYEQKETDKDNEAYNRVATLLESKYLETGSNLTQEEYDELKAYVESKREEVGEENAKQLDEMLDIYKEEISSTSKVVPGGIVGDVKSANSGRKNDDFKLEINGEELKLETNGNYLKSNDGKGPHIQVTNDFKKTNGRDPQYGDVIMYEGKPYMYGKRRVDGKNYDRWLEIQENEKSPEDYKTLLNLFG